jgi:hypothetical protein
MNASRVSARGRSWLVPGALASLVASIGLVRFGPDAIRVLGILTWRPGTAVETSLGGLAPSALWAALFGVGLALISVGYVVVASTRATSVAGRCLLASHGIATVCGALAILWGAAQVQRMFFVIARSETAPTAQGVLEAVGAATSRAQVGFVVLAAAQALLVAAGVVGLSQAAPRAGTLAGVRFLAGASALLALLVALMFAVTWGFHGRALERVFTQPGTAIQASVVARHFSSILGCLLLAACCLAMHGACQIGMALLLPGKSPKI